MKTITVCVDDDTYRKARIRTAEQHTSVSALLKRFLIEFAAGASDTDRLRREERILRERITSFRATDRMSREEAHRRCS